MATVKKYKPTTRMELYELCHREVEGKYDADGHQVYEVCLGDIDISEVNNLGLVLPHTPWRDLRGIEEWETGHVISMEALFRRSRIGDEISNWDVSQVRDMGSMFGNAEEVTTDFSKWNVSNVENMKGMFYGANLRSQIGHWDVSKVRNMEAMFASSNFNGDISGWDVSNVETMAIMFEESPFNRDLSRWNVAKLKNTHGMFRDTPFNGDLSSWKISYEQQLCSDAPTDCFRNELERAAAKVYQELGRVVGKIYRSVGKSMRLAE